MLRFPFDDIVIDENEMVEMDGITPDIYIARTATGYDISVCDLYGFMAAAGIATQIRENHRRNHGRMPVRRDGKKAEVVL